YQQKAGWFGHPRFSPDGRMIAYENHPTVDTDEGSIEGVDLSGKRTVLSKGSLSLEGLAWSPDGKEVWFAGASHSGWADSIHAVTLAGKERIVSLLPSVRLHDIARDGRVLLSRESWRTQLMGLFPGDTHEHPYSWLDGTSANAISADGRAISFYEGGEVYYIEGDLLGYYRRTDGSAAVRLGTGSAGGARRHFPLSYGWQPAGRGERSARQRVPYPLRQGREVVAGSRANWPSTCAHAGGAGQRPSRTVETVNNGGPRHNKSTDRCDARPQVLRVSVSPVFV